MAATSRPRSEEKDLDALDELSSTPDRVALNEAVRGALADRNYRVAAKGAALAEERRRLRVASAAGHGLLGLSGRFMK